VSSREDREREAADVLLKLGTVTPDEVQMRIVADLINRAERHGREEAAAFPLAAKLRRQYMELCHAIEYNCGTTRFDSFDHEKALAQARSLVQQIYERNRMDREGPEVEQSHPASGDRCRACPEPNAGRLGLCESCEGYGRLLQDLFVPPPGSEAAHAPPVGEGALRWVQDRAITGACAALASRNEALLALAALIERDGAVTLSARDVDRARGLDVVVVESNDLLPTLRIETRRPDEDE
jgi:hypothetical protein